tara:strand:- start:2687 stop:3928 length:1242 start_codon:yes stop_codon:yes gene_type:complete
MAKISNTTSYPNATPAANDYVIGTDIDDNNATKTFKLQEIANLYAGSGSGTVTSVGLSGGTTGITITSDTANPITTTGTFTLEGTLAVANGGTGLTSLTAGSVLLGGGSGNVSLLNTAVKGTILVGESGGTTALAVGTDGHVLTAASSEPSGVIWTPATASSTISVQDSGGTAVAGIDTLNFNSNLSVTTTLGSSTAIINATGGSGSVSITADNASTDYVDIQVSPSPITGTGTVSADLNATGKTSGGSTQFLRGDNVWAVPSYFTLPASTIFNNTLGFKGSSQGVWTTANSGLSTNIARKLEYGEFVYIQFYMVFGNSTPAAIGNLIMTGLPSVLATGIAVPQGSSNITLNTDTATSQNDFALVGRPGETGANEMSIKGHTASSTALVNIDAGTVQENAVISGTIQYLKAGS